MFLKTSKLLPYHHCQLHEDISTTRSRYFRHCNGGYTLLVHSRLSKSLFSEVI
jgi:hypothetical protein